MRRLRRLLRLPASDLWLLIKTSVLLEAIKLAMSFVPFRVLRHLVGWAARVPVRVSRPSLYSARGIGRVVQTASRHTPGEKTCLVQALATQVLLVRRGHPATLHIGASKTDEGAFAAHAWVECEGSVVIGEYELERYIPLTTLG